MLRRCTTIANVRPNECKCIQRKPAHTSWTVAGQRGELEDLLPLGLGVALTRTKVSVAPFGAAASLQVNSRFVLSFLITQRIHQSAHHLSLAKMGTTLSCLISSKQKEEKIANDRKHKRHKKKETACTQTFVLLCVCDSVYSFICLCLAGRLKTRRWWAISGRHIASFLYTAACFILITRSRRPLLVWCVPDWGPWQRNLIAVPSLGPELRMETSDRLTAKVLWACAALYQLCWGWCSRGSDGLVAGF